MKLKLNMHMGCVKKIVFQVIEKLISFLTGKIESIEKYAAPVPSIPEIHIVGPEGVFMYANLMLLY